MSDSGYGRYSYNDPRPSLLPDSGAHPQVNIAGCPPCTRCDRLGPQAEVDSYKQSSGHLLLLLMKLAMVSTASASIPK
jgi:hypothetical protein